MRRLLPLLAMCACGPPQTVVADPVQAPPLPEPATTTPFPLTRGEKHGETYLYDATIEESPPCGAKAGPIELRLYTTDINHVTLRLAVKNCGIREMRFLHDAQLQPSHLILTAAGKTLPFTDDRRVEKFDNTIHIAAFATLAPGEERAVEEGYFVPEGTSSTMHWQSFRASVPRGKWQAQVRFTSALSAGKEGKVPNVWIGTTLSNAVTVRAP